MRWSRARVLQAEDTSGKRKKCNIDGPDLHTDTARVGFLLVDTLGARQLASDESQHGCRMARGPIREAAENAREETRKRRRGEEKKREEGNRSSPRESWHCS